MTTGKTLVQRIALDGGKEIKTELESLGKTGEQAFKKLEDASKAVSFGGSALGARVKELQASFNRLGDAGGKLRSGFGELNVAAGRFGSSVGTVVTRVAGLSAALAAGAVAAGAFAFSLAKQGADAADAAGKAAQSAGIAIEAFTALQYAAGQSGVGVEEFATGMARLNKSISEAFAGDQKASKLFQQLGVSIRDAKGQLLPTEEILKRVSQAFKGIPDGAEKSALAMELFGRSGARLLPFLNSGRAGLEALAKEARESGLIFTAAQSKMAEAMNDSLSRLQLSIQATRNQIGLLFSPAITRGSDALIDVVNRNREAIIAFGRTVAGYAEAIASDLINLFMGRDEFVNRSWIITARDAVVTFGQAARDSFQNIIRPAFEGFMALLNTVASTVNRVFGTELTGAQLAVALTVAKIVGAFALIGPAVALVRAAFALLGPVFFAIAEASSVLAAGLRLAGTALLGMVGWPALIAVAIGVAIAAIIAYWDEIKAGAAAVFEALKGIFNGLWDAIKAGAQTAWNAVLDTGKAIWEGIKTVAEAAWNGIMDTFRNAWNSLIDGLKGLWTSFANFISGIIDRAIAGLSGLLQQALSIAQQIAAAISSAFAGAGNATGEDSTTMGFARGGHVRGRGTGTSDSILARLSNGEFVMRAAAVRKYGVQLLQALNAGRLPKTGLPQFATGGLVNVPQFKLGLPAFSMGGLADMFAMPGLSPALAMADGGSSGARVPVQINMPGGESFAMVADADVVGKMAKYASRAQLASAGRAPRWVGR